MRSARATSATCPASRCRRRCASTTRLRRGARATRAGGLIVIATPMAALRGDAARVCRRARAVAVALQGLRGGQRPARPRDRAAAAARGRASACCRGRASRSRSRAASRPRWSPRAATPRWPSGRSPRCTATRCASTPRSDPVGVEVGGAVKNVMAIATGIARRPATLGLNARAALITRGAGRDDAARRRARRARRDLHGPVGPRRPGAHRHRRPVAQPPVGLRLARGEALARDPGRARAMSPKAWSARRWCWRARARSASRCRSPTWWSMCSKAGWRQRWRRRV